MRCFGGVGSSFNDAGVRMLLARLSTMAQQSERLHEVLRSSQSRAQLGDFEQLVADAIVAAGAAGELQPHALGGLQVASNKSRLPHARKLQLATIAMGLSGSDSSKSVVKLTSKAMAALKDVEQLPDTGAVTKVANTGGGSRASSEGCFNCGGGHFARDPVAKPAGVAHSWRKSRAGEFRASTAALVE